MAKPTLELIEAIKRTIVNLQSGTEYSWGHMGSCNCGNLAQELTGLTKAEIHSYAMEKYGDWSEQIMDYCPVSGYPMDLLISSLLDKGLDLEDLKHLERLSNPEVLKRIQNKELKYNLRNDVIIYLSEWKNLLEEKLLNNIEFFLPTPLNTPVFAV